MGKREREKKQTNKTSVALLRSLLFAGKFAKRVLETVETCPFRKLHQEDECVCTDVGLLGIWRSAENTAEFQVEGKCNIQFGSEEKEFWNSTQLYCVLLLWEMRLKDKWSCRRLGWPDWVTNKMNKDEPVRKLHLDGISTPTSAVYFTFLFSELSQNLFVNWHALNWWFYTS